MKVFLTNDDGYQARGINELKQSLAEYDPTIIAPLNEMSSMGHGITMRNAFSVEEKEEKVFAVAGKPADCSLWAVDQLGLPDIVISGINHGSNLAQDIYYSGTVAAAREACFRGTKGIAISLANNDDDQGHFETACWVLKSLLKSSLMEFIDRSILVNINVPNLPLKELKGIRLADFGWRNYQAQYEKVNDHEYQFLGRLDPFSERQGSDTDYILKGFAAVSLLKLPESSCIMPPEIIAELKSISISE